MAAKSFGKPIPTGCGCAPKIKASRTTSTKYCACIAFVERLFPPEGLKEHTVESVLVRLMPV